MIPIENVTPTVSDSDRLPNRLEAISTQPRQRVQLPDPQKSPTRLLSQVERASVKVAIPNRRDTPNSILGEAAIRLSILDLRGLLPYLSGQYIAQHLHYAFFSTHPVALRQARRGWVLLGALDEADIGAEVWLSAEPLPDDPRQHFRRMRLKTRLFELDRSERRQPAPR